MLTWMVFINSHCIKEKMYKFRIPRKNKHWVYFYHSNLKEGPFGPPPVALGVNAALSFHTVISISCLGESGTNGATRLVYLLPGMESAKNDH